MTTMMMMTTTRITPSVSKPDPEPEEPELEELGVKAIGWLNGSPDTGIEPELGFAESPGTLGTM